MFEGSASPLLRRATPQVLPISNTFEEDFWIQALLLSSLVCNIFSYTFPR